MTNSPDLKTTAEACRILGVCPNTLTARVRDGIIDRVNINPRGQRPTWRYKLSGLDKLEDPEEHLKFLDLKRRCGL